MRPFLKIASNAFLELIRQPVFLILLISSSVFIVFLSTVYYFALGEDPKMVKDSTLAVIFIVGLFAAVISASSSVSRELRTGTALAVLAKPIGRARFLIAKYTGLAAALTLLVVGDGIAALLAGRMSFDAYGDVNTSSLFIFYGAIAGGSLLGGFTNYFLNRPFVSDAVIFTVLTMLLAAVGIGFFVEEGNVGYKEIRGFDWRMVPAIVLLLFAILLLAGVAIACSTRFDIIPTLAICSGIFLLGLMSDYLFGRPADDGSVIASVLYTIVPNWQLFWLADALEDYKTIPWSYVSRAFFYLIAYLGALLALALIAFEDRELN